MANINFFRVMQGGTWQVEDTESINFDFSCNNSTTVDLSTFSTTYTSSINFMVYAANSNTYSSGGGGYYLYASKYAINDDPDQMIQMFEYNYDSGDNLGFPKLDDMTDDVEGDGVKRWFIDNSDTITGGFPSGAENVFGFKQDIVVARTNNFNKSTYSSNTTQSINLNSALGFDPRFFNTSMQVFYTCTNADGSYNYNCSSSTIKDVIRIYSGSSGGVDNEVYFEIDSNNNVANVSSSYDGSTQGATYKSTSNTYTFKSTASAAGTTTFGLQYNNQLVFSGGATSLTQCEFTTHPTVIL